MLILQRLVGGVEEWGVWLDCSPKWLSMMPHYLHHLKDIRKRRAKYIWGHVKPKNLKKMCFCLYTATLCELTCLTHSMKVLIKCMGVVREQFSMSLMGRFIWAQSNCVIVIIEWLESGKTCKCFRHHHFLSIHHIQPGGTRPQMPCKIIILMQLAWQQPSFNNIADQKW